METIEDKLLPQALMMGVDYELFWTLNPKSLTPFTKAFSMKQEYDDACMWQLGNYIRIAIGSAMSNKNKYPEKPFSTKSKISSQDEIKRKFMERMEILNTRFGKEE